MAGKLIVHGVKNTTGTINIFLDGVQVAYVKKNDSVTIPIEKNCTMSIKCGINQSKPSMNIQDGMITEVQISYCAYNFSLDLISQTSCDGTTIIKHQEQEDTPVYNISGARGRSIKVYEEKCIITTKITFGSIISHNASDGEKTIYYSDCIGVQFKKAGFQLGYLQLETASSSMNNRGDNFFNENSFTFDTNNISNFEMEKVANYIRKQIEAYKQARNAPVTVTTAVSSADELKKFKELLDIGVITQEEFDAKKKQLLGL